MALPSTREELKEYCLRKLGHPVLEINISNDQMEDRIDEALDYFQQYHFDGVERMFIKHKITASSLTFAAPIVGTYQVGETVTGQTSNAKALVVEQNGSVLSVKGVEGTFTTGEVVLGAISGASNALAVANFFTLGDIDKRYIQLPTNVLSIINVYDVVEDSFTGAKGGDSYLFDIQYQFHLNHLPDLLTMDLISFQMFNSHMQMIEDMFYGKHPLRHNKKTDRLYIDFDWTTHAIIGKYIILEAYTAIDPAQYPKVWGDYFLREYCTTLFKKQWGTNLIKFEGIQLPGGSTLNGGRILDEANRELADLEERIHKEFQLPVDFLIG